MKTFFPPFLLGFLAAAFQIYLLREFSVHFYGNEITFGFVLASWLLWGSLGSLMASKFKFKSSRFPQIYYGVVLSFPLCLIGLRFSRYFLGLLPGEVTGTAPILFFSLALCFFINFPLGILFVFNVILDNGNITRVYIWESLGAAAGGLSVYLFLIPFFSNWQAVSCLGGLVSLLVFLFFGKKKKKGLLILILVVLAAFSLFDLPSQKIYWQPFSLIATKDSPYGKLQVIKTQEQISLYDNSLHLYSHPDLASSEETVHFAFLQRPDAESALFIGGGAGGSLFQALKYPRVEVDFVELDPEIIRLSLDSLPEKDRSVFFEKRIHIYYQDGRKFLARTHRTYDLILLNLPEPSTAQVNRFYTVEFFSLVKERLRSGGVFSFRVPSAENYISPELQKFLSTLYSTLKKVFPEVQIVPGSTNIFLASAFPLSIKTEELRRTIEELKLNNTYVSPHLLFSRLSPLRVEFLRKKIEEGNGAVNTDLAPVCYFTSSVLWSTQLKGLETRVLTFFEKHPSFWLLNLPLFLFLIVLIILRIRKTESSFYLVPLAVMGFTTIVCEIILVIWFQTLFGYIYGRIALLLTAFMAGLFVGALRSSKRRKFFFSQILVIQLCLVLLLAVLQLALATHPPELFLFAYLLFLGYFGGDLFVVSNRLFIRQKAHYGLGYGLDLIGSFLGAVAASSLIIPLLGLPLLVKYLLLLNSFCFLFLLFRPRT
ncbi:MAG: fused MFS/spermidine synthase [Candidatus Aminicenantales bacterium]